ncbi:SDR family oxidoreductase [Streptomyces luteogriseus]|uniref:SDR family oxidoreductase n=1 Tax=Streptomyces luteogriseus TaxID=68233 RepID=UPI0037BB4343
MGRTACRRCRPLRCPRQRGRAGPDLDAAQQGGPAHAAGRARPHRQRGPAGRAAQPEEIASTYVYLASDPDSSYTVGEVIAVTGGIVDTR